MKKKFLYTAIFAAMIGLASCNEDFNSDVAAPQSWEQEEAKPTSSMSITPVADINLETTTEERVKLFDYTIENQAEGNTISNLKAYVYNSAGESWKEIEIDENCSIKTDDLQAIIELFYGKEFVMRTLSIKAEASMNIDGEAIFLISEEATINVTPREPIIVPEYYIVGTIQNWETDVKTCALYPLDLEQVTFSYTTNFANGNGTPNFKIWAAADFGTWEKVLGTETDGDTSLTGRFVQGNTSGAIQTPENAIYTLTVNLLDMTYSMVKEEDQSPTEYISIGLAGAFNNWGNTEGVGDLDMSKASPHNWYYNGLNIDSEGVIKFRANDDWNAGNWGKAGLNIGDTPFGTTDYEGGDMTIPAGTYDVFFNDITGQFAFFAR